MNIDRMLTWLWQKFGFFVDVFIDIKLLKCMLAAFVLLFNYEISHAIGSGITYHGRIIRPDGVTPVQSPTTQFRIQVRTPGTENCLLWEEQQTKNLAASNGMFSVTIADTTEPSLIANVLPFSLERIFSNRTGFTALTGCNSGSSYTPNALDGRSLVVFFREAPTDPWEQIPATKVNFVPIALNSVQLEGYAAAEFLKVDPASTYTTLTPANVNSLVDLISGTSTTYIKPADALGGDLTGTHSNATVARIRNTNVVATAPTLNQVLKFNGTNWAPAADDTGVTGDASYAAKGLVQINTDQATSGLFIASGVLAMPNVITAGGPTGNAQTIPVITYDQKGRLTAVTTATVDDTSKLALAGGTMTGSINMGTNNITNATSVSATNASVRNLVLNDNDTNTITLRAPTDVTPSNYSLTFPAALGTNGYVLSTDGSGNLSWISPSSGSVTSVDVSVPAYMTSTGGPVTSTGTIALGFSSQTAKNVFAAPQGANGAPTFRTLNIADVQSSVAGNFLTGGSCTAGQALTYSSVSDTISCSNLVPSIDNNANLANTNIWVGDAGGKAQEVAMSGDATLSNTGALTLASTITAGSAGSTSSIPAITYDAKGRLTAVSASAYQDASGAQKGIVQIGSNITVSSGTISLDASNVTAALTYTPVNKAGDSMLGTLGLFQTASDPSTAGWDATQKGYSWFNTTSNQVKYWDGSAIQALGVSGAGLTSLGGQTGSTQTFAAGAAGNSPAISSASNVHTLNVPLASAGGSVTSGTISNADYVSFSGKLTSPLTTKGDILSRDATTHVRLDVGTNGQVLSANSATASGLEWITPTSGDITSVVAGDGLINGGTSGDVSLDIAAGTGIIVNANDIAVNVGTGNNQIVQLDGTARLPAVDGSQLTNLTASQIGSGVLPIARGGTNSGTALNNNRIMVSSSGAISESAALTNGQLLIGSTGAAPVAAAITQSTGMIITNGAGSISAAVDSGLGASKVPMVGGSALGANGVVLANGTATALTSLNCLVGQVLGFDASGFATCSTVPLQGGTFLAADGTAAAPSYSFNSAGNGDNGMFLPANNQIGFSTAGSERIRVDASGNVGIGTTSPNTALDVNGAFSQRGMAAPAVSPAGQGRIYYDSTSNKFRVSQNGAAYTDLVSAGGAATINDLTDAITDYSKDNIFLGLDSGISTNATADFNVGIGEQALQNLTSGTSNTAVGAHAMRIQTTQADNTAMGRGAGYNLLGSGNTAIGSAAMSASGGAGGTDNTAMGHQAMRYAQGNYNTAIGAGSMMSDNVGNGNTGVGAGALKAQNPAAFSDSTAVGSDALEYNQGSNNSALGTDALRFNSTGVNNLALGFQAGDNITTGSYNIVIGSVDAPSAIADYQLNIGDLIYGNLAAASRMVDINGSLNQRGIAAPAVSPAGQGRIYYDSTSNKFRVSQNGGAYADLVSAGGGLPAADGTAGAPSIAFTSDTNTGIFRPYADAIGFSVGGSNLYSMDANAFYGGDFYLSPLAPSSGQPSYAFNGDDNTGIYSPAADTIQFTTGGTDKVRITATGDVGIGTTNPISKLEVVGNFTASGTSTSNDILVEAKHEANTGAQSGAIQFLKSRGPASHPQNGDQMGAIRAQNGVAPNSWPGVYFNATENHTASAQGTAISFQTTANTTVGGAERMRITEAGNVGIGTNNPTNVLEVSRNQDASTDIVVRNASAGTSASAGFYGQNNASGDFSLGIMGSNANYSFLQPSDTYLVSTGGMVFWSNTGASSIRFANGASEMMRMDNATGNVGIGTSSPATALDVNGAVSVRGMAAPATSVAGRGRIYFDSTTNKFRVSENNGAYVDLIGGSGSVSGLTAGRIPFAASATSLTDSANLSYDATAGRITMGGTAPELSSANTLTLFTPWLELSTTGSNTKIFQGGNNSDTTVRGYFDGVSWFDIIMQPSGGLVGVGTTSPGAKLDVAGNVKLGSTGTAFTASGICTASSTAYTAGTPVNFTCTGVPASTNVAVNCSPSAALAGYVTARATGTVNQIAITVGVSATYTMTCMWMAP